MMPNRYPGSCLTCRTRVAAEAGVTVKVDGQWSVYCATHAPGSALPEPAAQTPRDASIALRMVDGRAQIRPNGYLGPDLFDRYRSACGGADYSRTERCNYASAELVGAIVTRLGTAGFKLDVDPEVTAAVQAWEARAQADTAAAAGRAAEIDARLRAMGKALFPFQAQGVSWLAPLSGAILGDDMGLGKTIQALCALPDGAPVLVIGPAVAKGVWQRECARWRPDLRVTVLEGRGSFRWPLPGEMVVTNYDILPDLDVMTDEDRKEITAYIASGGKPISKSDLCGVTADQVEKYKLAISEDDRRRAFIAACPPGLCVIADEAHAVKGKASGSKPVQRCARFKAICDAAYGVAKGRVWLLTATPLLNRPTELWNLLSLVRCHKVVFGSYSNFKKICGGVDNGWGTTWNAGGIQSDLIAPKLKQVMLRRLKVDVLDQLPAKTVEVVDVKLDTESIKRLDAIQAELAAQGIDLMEAMKAAAAHQDVAFDQISRARAILATAKAAAAMDLADDLEDAGEPCVVFSAHRAPIDTLAKRPGWAAITGDTPPTERTRIEEAFQRGELRGIAGTIKASGVAITLTRACHAIFIDSEWTPKLNEQAEDRIYRIGQANAVHVSYLKADHPIDDRVFELCAIKRGIVARTVDAAAHRDGALAERTNAAELLASSKVSADRVKRAQDDAELADRVRRERAQAEADRVRRKATVKAEAANQNRGWGIPAEAFETPPRAAQTAAEIWAVQGLAQLTAMDGDHAFEENGVGFNKADTFVGQALAAAASAGQLCDGEWIAAIKLLRKYSGQIGQCPDDEQRRIA